MAETDSSQLTRAEVVAIHGRFGHLLLRRCRMVLRDPALAEDAMQEAFINLIRYGAGYRSAERKLAWLYRVAERSCFRLLDKRDPAAPGDLAEDKEPAVRPQQELRAEAMSVLGQLDEEARTIAVLFFVDGLSQGEIGEQLGRSRQTINKKIQAVRRAAEAMKEGSA